MMKQVEFVEEKVLIGSTVYFAGDRKSFPEEEASLYISVGWAKDVKTGECGVRVPGPTPISVDNALQLVMSKT